MVVERVLIQIGAAGDCVEDVFNAQGAEDLRPGGIVVGTKEEEVWDDFTGESAREVCSGAIGEETVAADGTWFSVEVLEEGGRRREGG